MGGRRGKLFGRNPTPRCRVGELNKHLTEKSVAFAKMPSIFPIFPKFFPALKNSQLYRKIVGCLNFAHEGNFSREKTSLNADVISNQKKANPRIPYR